MEIIREALTQKTQGTSPVRLRVERAMLEKRRWRGRAEDGMEFGFDLDHPLADGDVFFENDAASYIIEQKPERVLEVRIGSRDGQPPPLPSATPTQRELQIASNFARLGWMIGNLHFPLALDGGAVLVPDDPALRQLFERERIAFSACERVFKPLSGGHSHGH